jgi:hypothetical protein
LALKNASQFLVTAATVAGDADPEPGEAAGELAAGDVGAVVAGVVAGDELDVLGLLLPQAAADAASADIAITASVCEIRR